MQWQDVNPSHCIFYLFISLNLSPLTLPSLVPLTLLSHSPLSLSSLTLLSHSPLTIGFNIVFPYLASYLCPKKLLLS